MRVLVIETGAYFEPMSLAELKLHLKMDDIAADDETIGALLPAARDTVETKTGENSPRSRTAVATGFALRMPDFPECGGVIDLPRSPLLAVSSITYVDASDVLNTLPTTVYAVQLEMGVIALKSGQSWPSVSLNGNAVTVHFVAGQAVPFVTPDTAADTLTSKGHSFTNGDKVRLMNSGGLLPAPLQPGVDYYVVSASGSTFKLSLTSSGAAVDLIANTGTGLHFAAFDFTPFASMRAAIKLLVGHWHKHPQAVIVGTIAVKLPISVDALCNAAHA